jgi:DNA repair protein RadC
MKNHYYSTIQDLFGEQTPANIQHGSVSKCPMLAEVKISYNMRVKSCDLPKITQSVDGFRYAQSMFAHSMEHHEEFYILLLSRSNRILGYYRVSSGGLYGTFVDAKIVWQAVITANACSVVLMHNHPSGNLSPSQADIDLTKKMKEGGKLLDISVLDHIIVTTDGFYSFADEGMM